MQISTQKTHFIIFGVIVTIFLAFNVFGIIVHLTHGSEQTWNKKVYSGKVAEITPDTLTIVNAEGVTHSFTLSPHSRYFAGHNQIIAAAVPVGQFVLVTVEDTATTTVRDIRVMKDGPRK